MFEAFLSSFSLVAISEFGDKTQLLAFSLAARFKKPWHVLAGVFVGSVLNHLLAASVGQVVATQIPETFLAIVLGIVFIGFGLWTLKSEDHEETDEFRNRGAFFTTALLFFLAEMGDKTQLATVALAAKYQSFIAVTAGTSSAMLITGGLAIFLGDRFAKKLNMNWIRWFAAGMFFLFGVLSLSSIFW